MSKELKDKWDFIEKYYPDYLTSIEVAKAKDLEKILHSEASPELVNKYSLSDSEVGSCYDRAMLEIFHRAVDAFVAETVKKDAELAAKYKAEAANAKVIRDLERALSAIDDARIGTYAEEVEMRSVTRDDFYDIETAIHELMDKLNGGDEDEEKYYCFVCHRRSNDTDFCDNTECYGR